MQPDEKAETVYTFICDYIHRNGYSPSQREIAAGCFLSKGAVTYCADRLELWGYLRRAPGKARSIWITAKPFPYAKRKTPQIR